MDFEFTPVDDLTKVPEQFRPIYAQQPDGTFAVGADFTGVATAITGFNKSNKTLRQELKSKAPVDLSALADYGKTPEEIKASIEAKMVELQDAAAKGADNKAALEKLRNDMTAARAAEQQKAQAKVQALEGQLHKVLIDQAATGEIRNNFV